MWKYPSLLSPWEFAYYIEVIPSLRELPCYVEPKWDGSNILCYEGICMNRALKPLSHPFDKGLREALGSKYPQLVRLSYEYLVFLELGGLRNSPAGYSRVWDAEWSYVIFDLMKGSKLLEPPEAARLVKEHGLRFVEYKRAPSISSVLEAGNSC